MTPEETLRAIERRYRWRRLNISLSGGRSSWEMTKRLREVGVVGRRNVVITFANTAEEDERTLQYVDELDRAYDLGVVWVEARVDPRDGAGTRHRIVTFETASRHGEPFERVIEKYGLPGPGYLHCTRELKANPIKSYLRSIGWGPGSYDTAIGLRADETDRTDAEAAARRFVYPLISLGLSKPEVYLAISSDNVQLVLEEALGNCTWCWKKSLAKLVWLMRNRPEVFDFPRRMEAEHAFSGAGDGRRRYLFRYHMTVADIERLAPLPDAEITAWLAARLKIRKAEAVFAMQTADECHGVCDAERIAA